MKKVWFIKSLLCRNTWVYRLLVKYDYILLSVSCINTIRQIALLSVPTTRNQFSVNRGPCLQAKSTNLFLPQSFQNSLPNGGSAWSASSSFTIPRSSNGNVRSRLSEKLQSQHLYLNEDDSDVSDTKSDCSRQTSVCPVDSTTKQTNAFSFSKYLEITRSLLYDWSG